jgi:hypothetical protein
MASTGVPTQVLGALFLAASAAAMTANCSFYESVYPPSYIVYFNPGAPPKMNGDIDSGVVGSAARAGAPFAARLDATARSAFQWQHVPWTTDLVDIRGPSYPVAPYFRTRGLLLLL